MTFENLAKYESNDGEVLEEDCEIFGAHRQLNEIEAACGALR